MALVFEQQIVHFPEPALTPGALGGLSRVHRVRVHFLQREMTECETHLILEAREQQSHRARRLFALWAFEIAVFDECDGGGARAQDVVRLIHGLAQCKFLRLHAGSSTCRSMPQNSCARAKRDCTKVSRCIPRVRIFIPGLSAPLQCARAPRMSVARCKRKGHPMVLVDTIVQPALKHVSGLIAPLGANAWR